MVKHFDPECPNCKLRFHVHHEDLRHANVKLLCPYCSHQFHVAECDSVIEHDGTLSHPRQAAHAK
jgi:predicted Zn finger-like uncharacterized protein